MPFDLQAGTRLVITKTTPRKEIHGDEHMQAISLRLAWTTSNDALSKLHPNLRDMLFYDPPEVVAQREIEGLDPVKKHRRCPAVSMPLKLEAEFTGCTLTIDHGIDDSSALELYACALSKFTVEALEGGSVTIAWSAASNKEITPELVGALCALEGDEVAVQLLPPASADGTIDGSVGAFKRDHPQAGEGHDAGDLFSQQHGGASDQHAGDFGAPSDDESDLAGEVERGGENWPEQDAGADSEGGETDGAGDAAEFEAGAAAAIEKATGRRGRKTRAVVE